MNVQYRIEVPAGTVTVTLGLLTKAVGDSAEIDGHELGQDRIACYSTATS